MALTPSRRSELRSEAHALTPVVIIGDKGLTDEVMAEIDRSLKAHELIKVRANTNDRDARELWMEKICERLDAHAVQQIGKILVVYRQNFDKPRGKESAEAEDLPAKKKRSGTDDPRKRKLAEQKRREAAATTRTSRPRSRTPSTRPESGSRRRPRSTSR
jgi:putative YhbY family RNA-binding protein